MSRASLLGNSRHVALHPEAHALTVFRVLPNGDDRSYTATWFPRDPWRGCERFIRTARAVGWLCEPENSYALIDVLNENGDIVQDFGIRDAESFQRIKRSLKIIVDRENEHA